MTSRKRLDRTSSTDEWETPREIFDALNKEYGPFTFDPFCRPDQYTAQAILSEGGNICVPPPWPGMANMGLTKEDQRSYSGHIGCDGLAQQWSGRVYMNPPYDAKFLWAATAHAIDEVLAEHVELVCALLPVKSEQGWWQEFVLANTDQVRR